MASSMLFSVRCWHFWHSKIAVTCRRESLKTLNKTSIAVGPLWAPFAPRSSSSRAARYKHLHMSAGEVPLLVDVVAADPWLCSLLIAGGGLGMRSVLRPMPSAPRLPCPVSDQALWPEPNPREYESCRTRLLFLLLLLLLLLPVLEWESTDIVQDGGSPPPGLGKPSDEIWSKPLDSPYTNNSECQYKHDKLH
jgi:hypothetical protein